MPQATEDSASHPALATPYSTLEGCNYGERENHRIEMHMRAAQQDSAGGSETCQLRGSLKGSLRAGMNPGVPSGTVTMSQRHKTFHTGPNEGRDV